MAQSDNNIDNSEMAKLIIEQLSKKKQFDEHESQLKQLLLERVGRAQMEKSDNPQKVLDSAYFNGLTLTEKINFINSHKGILSRKPNFSWKNVGIDTASSAALAGTGTLLHQVMTSAGKTGGFQPHGWALGGAIAMGGLVGAALSAARERKDYKKDLDTQKNIDDAISVLVDRGLRPVPTRTDYVAKVRNNLEEMPVNYGKSLSSIDFSKIN